VNRPPLRPPQAISFGMTKLGPIAKLAPRAVSTERSRSDSTSASGPMIALIGSTTNPVPAEVTYRRPSRVPMITPAAHATPTE
jgi:hypothetical protein